MVVCFLGSPGKVSAQATATGRITAEVVDVLATSAGSQGTFFTIPARYSAVSTSSESVSALNINTAVFSISGMKDATFEVALPKGPTTIAEKNGLGTIQISDWTALSDQGINNHILYGGVQRVNVGATIRLASGNESPRGVYTGSYQVTFVYN